MKRYYKIVVAIVATAAAVVGMFYWYGSRQLTAPKGDGQEV